VRKKKTASRKEATVQTKPRDPNTQYSYRPPRRTWKRAKHLAVARDISLRELLNTVLEKEVKAAEKKGELTLPKSLQA